MGTPEATSVRETLMGNKSDLPQTTMFIKMVICYFEAFATICWPEGEVNRLLTDYCTFGLAVTVV